MQTFYAACLARLGLSQPEAARLHDVRLDTIKSWSAGRSVPALGWDAIMAELREYEADIIDRSEALREAWEDAGGDFASEPLGIDAAAIEPAQVMALADFLLTTDVLIGQLRIRARPDRAG